MNSRQNGLSTDGDILKLVAAAAMFVDHIGAFLFPQISILRITGRIAFPIFAFFVAEGCSYTKNRKIYLVRFIVFAAMTQAVKIVFGDTDDLNILFTFAAAVVIVFAFQETVQSLLENSDKKTIYKALFFVLTIVFAVAVNSVFKIQYGIWGCFTPFAIYLAKYINPSEFTQLQVKLIVLAVMLTLVYLEYGGVQSYAYLALPLLMTYSGKKGNRVPKYFFWLFYPAHLLFIYAIGTLIQ